MVLDKMRGYVWRAYLMVRGATVGSNLQVHGTLDILLRDGASYRAISIGDNVAFGGKAYFRMRREGSIVISSDIRIGTEVWLVTAKSACLSIGNHTALGSYGIYNAGHGIQIGENSMLAGFVYLNSSNHAMARGSLIRTQGHTGSPIRIGDDVWIGGHVSITSGVTVGDGAVAGTGSVVTRDVPPYAIVAGVPARVLRYRE
jgi:acetyltransferase-like isoleucine patch superfamily enzyme